MLLPILVAMLGTAPAQRRGAQIDIHVRVRYPNEQPTQNALQVVLLNAGGVPMGQTFTNSTGDAMFHVNSGGEYRVRVSGPDIEKTTSDSIMVSDQDRIAVISVTVKPVAAAADNTTGGGMTSASELKIPQDARKTFNKGSEALQNREYAKAIQYFEKATRQYPQYDSAFDNLGVALMRLGQEGEAAKAFEKAVQLNDKNAEADRNYARYLLGTGDYVHAKEYLEKSLVVDPQNAGSLALLAIAQFESGDYDAALKSATSVNNLPRNEYTVSHYIAARIYQNKGLGDKATSEYQAYLKESPDGPYAEQARAALAQLSAASKTPQ